MSADRLREAAKVLRDPFGPWGADMAPTVGSALADWLDAVAERQKPADTRWGGRSHGWTGSRHANAVADAILGGAS